jgi:lysophospholipase L1-like esterase
VKDYPQAVVHNAATYGATVAEVLTQLRTLPQGRPFDLALVFAGGNDVLQRTPQRVLRDAIRELLDALHERCGRIVWVGMANVGLAPAFLPPLSWWLTFRTRRVSRIVADEVARRGDHFVDFFRERAADPFSAEPQWFYADDGVHPSAHAYAYTYDRIRPLLTDVLGTPQDAEAAEEDSLHRDAAQRARIEVGEAL